MSGRNMSKRGTAAFMLGGGGLSSGAWEMQGKTDKKKAGGSFTPLETAFGTEPEVVVAPDPGNDPSVDDLKKREADEELRQRLRLSERGGRASTILNSDSAADGVARSSTRRTLFGE